MDHDLPSEITQLSPQGGVVFFPRLLTFEYRELKEKNSGMSSFGFFILKKKEKRNRRSYCHLGATISKNTSEPSGGRYIKHAVVILHVVCQTVFFSWTTLYKVSSRVCLKLSVNTIINLHIVRQFANSVA